METFRYICLYHSNLIEASFNREYALAILSNDLPPTSFSILCRLLKQTVEPEESLVFFYERGINLGHFNDFQLDFLLAIKEEKYDKVDFFLWQENFDPSFHDQLAIRQAATLRMKLLLCQNLLIDPCRFLEDSCCCPKHQQQNQTCRLIFSHQQIIRQLTKKIRLYPSETKGYQLLIKNQEDQVLDLLQDSREEKYFATWLLKLNGKV